MSSSLEQLHAERAAFVKRYEDSQRELSQIREDLKARQDQLSALEERKTAAQEQLSKVIGLIKDTESKRALVGPELTARLMGPLEIERRSLQSEAQRVEAELGKAHASAAEVAQKLGPAFQQQQRFEEVLNSLDEMIQAGGASPAQVSPAQASPAQVSPAQASPAQASPLPPPVSVVPSASPAQVSEDVRPVRVAHRTSINFELHVDQESEHNFYTGFTDNISEGGLFIATDQRIDLGRDISFTLDLPTFPEAKPLSGEVRWVRYSDEPQDGSPNGVGVQFLNLDPMTKAAIESFIKERESIFYDE